MLSSLYNSFFNQIKNTFKNDSNELILSLANSNSSDERFNCLSGDEEETNSIENVENNIELTYNSSMIHSKLEQSTKDESINNPLFEGISLEVKKRIASEINSGQKCSFEVAISYNLKASRVNYYARKIRLGENICSMSGRPKAIDNESELIITALLNSPRYQNINRLDERKKLLRKEIRNQIKLSFLRRSKQKSLDQVPKVSYRTLNRYIEKFFK
jgi:hypothetical protein